MRVVRIIVVGFVEVLQLEVIQGKTFDGLCVRKVLASGSRGRGWSACNEVNEAVSKSCVIEAMYSSS